MNEEEYFECGTKRSMEHIDKLAEILKLGVFEPLIEGNCIKLVYLMNDAVESFLVFEKGRMVGECLPEDNRETKVSLDDAGREFVLVVRQPSGNVFTVFFERISMEVQLYNYANIGHFWMDGMEELRQIEYKVAILSDKYDYLGREYCNSEELALVSLAEFPPLHFFPSVPEKYRVIRKDEEVLDSNAVNYMQDIARAAGDVELLECLNRYSRKPCMEGAKIVAEMFTKKEHEAVLDVWLAKVQSAAGAYPERTFEGKEKKKKEELQVKAQQLLEQRKKKHFFRKRQFRVWYEEPFVVAGEDEFPFRVHVVERYGRFGRLVYQVHSVEE